MANVNPGPASTSNANSVATLTPVNTQSNPDPQEANQLRLLAVAKSVPLGVAGDPVIVRVRNASRWTPSTVVTSNGLLAGVSGDVHLATVGIYTAVAAGGTAVLTTAALTGQTTSAFTYIRASTTTSAVFTQQTLYIHIVTTVATGTTDLFLYGYDVS